MTACCFLLAWWVPTDDEMRFAQIYFEQWRPSLWGLRITTEEQFCQLLGYEPGLTKECFEWPDFSKCDVIPIPLNGLAGEATAEHRIHALDRPADVDLRNMPLREVVEVLRQRCGIELQYDLREFASAGVDPEMPITFQAEGIALRDALHSMLDPLGLTLIVREGEIVCITTQSCTQKAYGPSIIDRKDWFDYREPVLGDRLRLRGRLVVVTSFLGNVETDSRAVGYTVPKGAKVIFVNDRIASAIDAC